MRELLFDRHFSSPMLRNGLWPFLALVGGAEKTLGSAAAYSGTPLTAGKAFKRFLVSLGGG